MNFRKILAASLGALMVASASPSFAGVQYFYDSSGRLIRAVYSNGITIEYRYDAAGNRTQILTSGSPVPPNSPPSAVNDSATVNASQSVDIQVRLNDSDPNGHPLSITSVGTPTGGGSVSIMGGGAYVRYTAPASGGTKTFSYTISDGNGGTSTATVTVTVNAPLTNQPPVAHDDSEYTVAQQSIAIMVLANDTDANNHPLTVTALSNVTAGSASIASGGGYVVYNAPITPGYYSFDYAISDGNGGTASATVWIQVACDPSSGQMCEA